MNFNFLYWNFFTRLQNGENDKYFSGGWTSPRWMDEVWKNKRRNKFPTNEPTFSSPSAEDDEWNRGAIHLGERAARERHFKTPLRPGKAENIKTSEKCDARQHLVKP